MREWKKYVGLLNVKCWRIDNFFAYYIDCCESGFEVLYWNYALCQKLLVGTSFKDQGY